ncbi:MAG: hypothetical protein WCA78_04945 [Rhizomicrobium sp.]
MVGRIEGIGIATLLVLLILVALPCADARPGNQKDSAVISGKTTTCDPNLAGADYVGGVDVAGNRITPADIGGEDGVDLSQASAIPILKPGRHGRQVELLVQGVKPAKSAAGCKRQPH